MTIKLINSCPVVKIIFAGLIFLLIPTYSNGQNISVESSIDKSTVTVGELVQYEIKIKFDPEIQVAAPPPGINLGGFEIRDYKDNDPVNIDGVIEKTVEFSIAAYDTGNFAIPPTGIAYMTPDSATGTLFTDVVNIRVETVHTGESEDILDLKSTLDIPMTWTNIIIFSAIGLLVLAGGIFWYLHYRKKKQGGSLFEWTKDPDKPAHEAALEALDNLRSSILIKEGRIKEYYIILSEIMRMYLQNRYFVPVMEKTTAETLDVLNGLDIEEEPYIQIKELLEVSDMVKFAKFRPGEELIQSCLQKGYDIVDSTKIIEMKLEEPEEQNETAHKENNEKPEVVADEEEVKALNPSDHQENNK